jgi:hypothetical protein
MKTFAFVICLLGTVFLKFADYSNHYKVISERKQEEVDSLKVLLYDIQRDTIIHKMLTDFAYRTKVNTLVKVLPDAEIIRLINRHKLQQKQKKSASIAGRKSSRQKAYVIAASR